LQQEYFHTPEACSDLYFEIAMQNHEKKDHVCFHAKSSKDSIHSIILEKKSSENVSNIKKKMMIHHL